ncbi:Inner membrane transport protein YdhC [Dolichospermum sp. UHCC 0315A]|uniref:MFS transporter n=1 Tax=Dolichospermum sp. UHCC 0315A TaxID=1914871 RepID=UPI0011E67E71|nr:MFS transporter [Dolichospermum sp. UHCC 0315A]QEI41435.1 Inner membrane transport protein YdhC [Dolichospermum sp. UHCC 0315A]
MKAFDTFDANLRKNLLMLFAAGLFFWSGLASLLPTLPLYIEHIGASKQEIGIVMGSFAIGMLLCRPSMGALADIRGRKIVLLIGMSVAAIAPLGYLFVKSIIPLMIIRSFHGISIAAFATAYIALVSDLAPEHRRGEVVGYMSLVNPLGVALGPAIGGFLQASAGYTPLFLSSAALGSMGLLCIIPIVNPPIITKPHNSKNDNFWQILTSPRVRIPAIVLLLSGLTLGSLHTFISLFIKSTGVDLNPGFFFSAAAVSSFSCRLFSGKASDRYGRGLFVTMSLIAYTLSIICVWQANNSFMFLLGALMEGAASGTLIPMISVLMTDRALPHERGRIFGASLMGFDIGLAIAGPIFGTFAETLGYRNMFGLTTGLTVIAMIIFLTQSSRNIPQSLRFAFGRTEDIYAVK